MTSLFTLCGNSLRYGFGTCAHNPLRWLALTFVLIIPILNFLGFGILLKILRKEEPTFENGGKAFVQGLLAFIITLIYLLIPLGLQMLTGSLGILGIVLSLLIYIIFSCALIPALVNFGRKQKFLAAFMFPEIFANIGRITWGRFILALLFFIIVEFIIALILMLIGVVPVLGWIVLLVLVVPLSFFQAKFWNDVLE